MGHVSISLRSSKGVTITLGRFSHSTRARSSVERRPTCAFEKDKRGQSDELFLSLTICCAEFRGDLPLLNPAVHRIVY